MANLTTATLPRHQKPQANGLNKGNKKDGHPGPPYFVLLAGNDRQNLAIVGILNPHTKAAAVIGVVVVVDQ